MRSVALLLGFCWAISAVNIVVDTSQKYQVIQGFGAAIAYYDDWLTAHPNKAQIYPIIFADLSLDILRFRNYFYYDNTSMASDQEIYQQGTKSLGYPPALLLSSWSPPPELKSDDNVDYGTLKQQNGQFVYDQFGQYWHDSLTRYRNIGMNFTYISIQNEPDMNASYDSCEFAPTEQNGLASYASALDAVYNALTSFANRPKILGPEVLGIGYNDPENYLKYMNLAHIDGINHHLYHGGDYTNPDSFQSALAQLQQAYPNQLKYQTEYYEGDWLQTAWLMHECLTVENAVAYLYWDLIWGDDGGLVTLYNPWEPQTWPNQQGYLINKPYYGFKQFSGYVNPGDIRITANVTSNDLRVSAYLSSNGSTLTVVIINVNTSTSQSITFTLNNWGTTGKGPIYQTTNTQNCTQVGTYSIGNSFTVPSYSVTTVVISK